MDAEDTLAELLGYLADPDLPPEYREALQQACDALQVAGAVAAAERQRSRALFAAVPHPVSVIAWAGTVLDLDRSWAARRGGKGWSSTCKCRWRRVHSQKKHKTM